MKLYTVIPIAKGVGKETLSYFGPDSIEPGALVSIPLRKKTGYGLVVDKKDVTTAKSEIKSSSFSLKKILRIESKKFLSSAFIRAASETSQFYAASTGSTLIHLVPESVLETAAKEGLEEKGGQMKLRPESLVVQGDTEDRFAHYKSFIRGQFARRHSVFFCLPTIESIRQAKTMLEKGIGDYTVIFHSGLSKKEFTKAIRKVREDKHPLLIIATPPFLSLTRDDIGSIILDRENSRAYRTQKRPFIDLRVFVEKFAQLKQIPLLRGDLLLSIETLWKWKNDEYAEFAPLKMRALSSADNLLVDMKKKLDDQATSSEEGRFQIMSSELKALIIHNQENSERLFIWSARKGLAPTTLCGDCGTVVLCGRCDSPVTLYSGKRDEENFFMCNKCGLKRSAAERCHNCQSWKLHTLGIGLETVETAIRKEFPDVKIFRLDKDSVRTEKKALETMRYFYSTPGSILLGTEMALFYFTENVENAAVASIDSLFSLPDFRISEKILYSLLAIRSRAEKVFLIQTRNATNTVFECALKGNLIDFYKDEIADRESFQYPPFSIFIKISIEGTPVAAAKAIEELSGRLAAFGPKSYQAFSPSKRGNSVYHILISKHPKEWPDEELLSILKSLPPSVAVRVDPETLL